VNINPSLSTMKQNVLKNTLKEVNKFTSENSINFTLTRYNNFQQIPGDLDILVSKKDFNKFVIISQRNKYIKKSHDYALGGRIKGAQVNLDKNGRIKIDLHQDFTWRKSQYLDLEFIRKNIIIQEIDSIKVKVPRAEIDVFLIFINLIFEKTYISKEDYVYTIKNAQNVFNHENFSTQASKYGWVNTWNKFITWYTNTNFKNSRSFPVFLPFTLIMYSYYEKLIHEKQFDLSSFAYYLFFRARYSLNKTLPYD